MSSVAVNAIRRQRCSRLRFIAHRVLCQTRALGMLMLLNLRSIVRTRAGTGSKRRETTRQIGFSRMRKNQDKKTQPTVKSMHHEKEESRERPIT